MRARFSSLQGDFVFLDAPGGSQVPDEVGDAIARTLREASANIGAPYATGDRVAEILGLSHRNSVSLYQRRYADMPRPVLDLGQGRVKLWLRPEIEKWAEVQASAGRTRRGLGS